MNIEKGDIVLLPFPFTNLRSTKVRPALVIHTENKSEDAILIAISSKKTRKNEIEFTNNDMAKGSLPVISYIKYKKVTTLSKSIVKRNVGKLKEKRLKEVLKSFKTLF